MQNLQFTSCARGARLSPGRSQSVSRHRSPRTHCPSWHSSPLGAPHSIGSRTHAGAVPCALHRWPHMFRTQCSYRCGSQSVHPPPPSSRTAVPPCPLPMLRVALHRRSCRRERYGAAARRCAVVARGPTRCQGRSSRCARPCGPAALSALPRDRHVAFCASRSRRPDGPCLASPPCAAICAPHARPLPHRRGSVSWSLQWAARK